MLETITKQLSAAQKIYLRKFADRLNRFGVAVGVFDVEGETILYSSPDGYDGDAERLSQYSKSVCTDGFEHVVTFDGSDDAVGICLSEGSIVIASVVVDLAGINGADNKQIEQFCREHKLDAKELEGVFKNQGRDSAYIAEILNTLRTDFENSARSDQQIEMVSTELAQTYEELVLLYNMSTNMKVTQSNSTYLQIACDQITQMVNVEGIAIFLEREGNYGKELGLTAGSGVFVIDQTMIDILQHRLADEMREGKEALLDSDVDSPFKYSWPDQIQNIIAVPMMGNDHMTGMMVATNRIGKPDFDSIEVKLFNSVANQCAVFVENGQLFGDLKELFMGSLKALTNSIDAKDQYTRGHSERVAFISRWIAEEMSKTHPIPEEEIHKIYLAALLHDIGKIGIDEQVLRKNRALTEQERIQIMSHPKIGATILSDIKQMKEVIQGVLCHHERIDGKGYPNRLTGDQIPLMGKIISIADSFDAMTSKRVYRDAMSLDRAIEQIEKGLGTQFDPDAGKAFINGDVKNLWRVIQDGYLETWDFSNFAEYGSEAIGTLLR